VSVFGCFIFSFFSAGDLRIKVGVVEILVFFLLMINSFSLNVWT